MISARRWDGKGFTSVIITGARREEIANHLEEIASARKDVKCVRVYGRPGVFTDKVTQEADVIVDVFAPKRVVETVVRGLTEWALS